MVERAPNAFTGRCDVPTPDPDYLRLTHVGGSHPRAGRSVLSDVEALCTFRIKHLPGVYRVGDTVGKYASQTDQMKPIADCVGAVSNGPVAKLDEPMRLISDDEWSIDSLQRRLESVQRSVVLAISDPVRSEYQDPVAENMFEDLLAQGKWVQILVSPSYMDSREGRPLGVGAPLMDRIRVSRSNFGNTLVLDGREAVVWFSADSVPRTYVFSGADLPGTFEKLVTRAWSAGLPLRDHLQMQRKNFDSIAIAVLRSLDAGVTDEVAARQLSVSLRTYRRHVASIMEKLNITTRFQLGVRATELGLLH